jgi:hypothetical protein
VRLLELKNLNEYINDSLESNKMLKSVTELYQLLQVKMTFKVGRSEGSTRSKSIDKISELLEKGKHGAAELNILLSVNR